VNRKKKLILIGLAIALAVGLGGLAYAQVMPEHQRVGGNKLIGVGEMGYVTYGLGGQYEWWDSNFIITNPNCERYLTIEWVSLIASEDVYSGAYGLVWQAEEVIAEGTPEQWGIATDANIPPELSPHEVWQVSIAELFADLEGGQDPDYFMDNYELSKYTLEVTWSDEMWRGWWAWRWGYGRPLIGWQKEKCWTASVNNEVVFIGGLPGFAISEDEMLVFPRRTSFRAGEPYFSVITVNGNGTD